MPFAFSVPAAAQDTVLPSAVIFVGLAGGSDPAAQTLQVTTSSANSWTATTSTNNGVNWLNISSGASGTGNGTITITAGIQGAPAGQYFGQVQVQIGSFASPNIVSVELDVVTTSLTFTAQAGGTNPPSQTLQLATAAAGSGQVTWTAAVNVSTPSGGNWLSASPTTGQGAPGATGTTTVSIDTTGLAVGTYAGSVRLNGATPLETYIALNVVTAGGPAVALAKASGDNQTGIVSTALATPLTVNLTDANGNPAATTSVTFTVTAGGGTFSNGQSSIVVSSSGGAASTTYTLGTTAGTNTVTASAGTAAALNATFTATATAGAVSQIVLSGTLPASAAAATQVPVSVLVQDASSNPIPNFQVSFAVTAGGGTVSPATAATNSSGIATTTWTTGSSNNTLVASGTGVVSLTMQVNVTTTTPPPTPAPPAVFTVSPTTINISAVQGGPSPTISPIVITTRPASPATWTAVIGVGGGQPAWLALSSLSGSFTTFQSLQPSINLTGLAVGTYIGTATFTSSLGNGVVAIHLTVTASTPAQMALQPANLTFTANAPATAPQTQAIHVSNTGGGSLTVQTATVKQSTGASWLAVSPPTAATAPLDLTVTVNPTGLNSGAYTGLVTITGSDGTISTVGVYLNVAANALQVDNSLLTLVAMAGQPAAVTANLNVASATSASQAFTTQLSVPVSPPSWAVSPTSGSTPLSVQVSATPGTTLAAGNYSGGLTVGTANSSPSNAVQVGLNLNVYPSTYAPAFSYTLNSGIIGTFNGSENEPEEAQSPAGQTATPSIFAIAQPAGMTFTYNSTTGVPAVTVAPATTVNGSCLRLGGQITNDPNLYTYQYCAVGSTLVAASTPTLIVNQPMFDFSGTVGQPMSVQAALFDVNGTPIVGAIVRAQFSNGEPNLALSDAGNGYYSAAWTPVIAGAVSMVFAVQNSTAPSVVANGTILAAATPIAYLARGGAVNGASFATGAPLAPGSIASVFGANLPEPAAGIQNYLSPVATTLGGLTLAVNGNLAPLFYVGQGQINFQVPYEVSGQTSATLQLTAGLQVVLLQNVALSPASAGIFVTSGTQGAVLHANGSVVTPSNPAVPNEVISIYATGLGPVNNQPATGALVVGSSSTMVTMPTVTIGGATAVVQFAGLAPNFAGLYQINVVTPNITYATATAVPVVITTGVAQSNTVTIGVQ